MKLYLTTIDGNYELRSMLNTLYKDYKFGPEELEIVPISVLEKDETDLELKESVHYKVYLMIPETDKSLVYIKTLRESDEGWEMEYHVQQLIEEYNIDSDYIRVRSLGPTNEDDLFTDIKFEIILNVKRSPYININEIFGNEIFTQEKEEDTNETEL